MTIKKKSEMPDRKIEIDLSGPDGNAFVLMGIAAKLYRQMHGDKDFTPIRKAMTDGDYEHLLKVFEREFGEYVDLYR